MVGTRKLRRLLEHAERDRAKVVLVDDPRQLPEIQAGGGYVGLSSRLGKRPFTTTDANVKGGNAPRSPGCEVVTPTTRSTPTSNSDASS